MSLLRRILIYGRLVDCFWYRNHIFNNNLSKKEIMELLAAWT